MVQTAPPGLTAPHTSYAGLVTRGIALAVDAAIANLIVLVVAALLALVASLVGDLKPQWLAALIASVGWALAVAAYFTLFWTTTGQTPGMRMMRLRVVTYDGGTLNPGRSIVRLIGLALAIIPLFAGFLPVLFDERRRALQDFLARTVVIHSVE